MTVDVDNFHDEMCHHLVGLLPLWGTSKHDEHDRPTQELVISGLLRLVRTAVDNNRNTDVHLFYTQLYHYEEHMPPPRYRSRQSRIERQASSYLDTLMQAGRVIIAGWCVKACKPSSIAGADNSNSAATELLAQCASVDYGMPYLMKLWREITGRTKERADDSEPSLLDRLGIYNWDSETRDYGRPGFSTAYSPDSGWLLDGVLVLMMCQKDTDQVGEQNAPAAVKCWDINYIRERINILGRAAWMPEQGRDKEERYERIIALLEEEELQVARAKIITLHDAPLDDMRVKRLAETVESNYSKYTRCLSKLLSVGVGESSTGQIPPTRIRRRWNIWKDQLAAGYDTSQNLADVLARDIGKHIDAAIFYRGEASVKNEGVVFDAGDLKENIESAIAILARGGIIANAMIVPYQMRMWQDLHKLADVDEYAERDVVASWFKERFGFTLIEWPYINAEMMLICNTREMFARHDVGSEYDILCIEVITSNDQSNKELMEQANAATTLTEMPETNDLVVEVEVSVLPNIVVANINGAIGISIPKDLDEDANGEE